MYHERFLRRAIELSAQALEMPGTEPFAAVIVKDDRVVGEGINRSRQNYDPTAHGETEAIRDACRRMQTVDLRGCELYSSCEPCALCVGAMQISRINRLYYAAGLTESNAALESVPLGVRFAAVDATTLREECGRKAEDSSMPVKQALSEEAMAVIVAWAEQVT